MSGLIIVGVDGSAAGHAAVRWAADDALRMHAEVRLVTAVHHRWPYDIPKFPTREWQDEMIKSGEKVLAEAENIVRDRQPTVEVTTRLVEGPAAVVLREQAKDATEIVIGSRGLGGFAGALLGSVSTHVAGHAPCPVVVVRGDRPEPRGEIVVGVDDADACEPALAYAFEHARLRGSRLRTVYAWQLPVHAYAPEVAYDLDEVRDAHREAAAERIAGHRRAHPEVPVIEDVRAAHPVEALCAASAEADLVVVGSHGRGTLGAIVLGSVSRGVLHHAASAVAVVRA
jgi:nucleotide-binding universal stress UspA family protein